MLLPCCRAASIPARAAHYLVTLKDLTCSVQQGHAGQNRSVTGTATEGAAAAAAVARTGLCRGGPDGARPAHKPSPAAHPAEHTHGSSTHLPTRTPTQGGSTHLPTCFSSALASALFSKWSRTCRGDEGWEQQQVRALQEVRKATLPQH